MHIRLISLLPVLPKRMTKPTTRLSKVFQISLSILGEARAEKHAADRLSGSLAAAAIRRQWVDGASRVCYQPKCQCRGHGVLYGSGATDFAYRAKVC